MDRCLHLRRWIFRQTLRLVGHRPVVPVVERCLECHELLRPVEPAEVRELMLSAQLLDADPWEAAHA